MTITITPLDILNDFNGCKDLIELGEVVTIIPSICLTLHESSMRELYNLPMEVIYNIKRIDSSKHDVIREHTAYLERLNTRVTTGKSIDELASEIKSSYGVYDLKDSQCKYIAELIMNNELEYEDLTSFLKFNNVLNKL